LPDQLIRKSRSAAGQQPSCVKLCIPACGCKLQAAAAIKFRNIIHRSFHAALCFHAAVFTLAPRARVVVANTASNNAGTLPL
jgi:hypothetical protein